MHDDCQAASPPLSQRGGEVEDARQAEGNPTPGPLPFGKGEGRLEDARQAVIVHCFQTPPPAPPLWERGGEAEDARQAEGNPTPGPSPLGKGRGGLLEPIAEQIHFSFNS